MVSLGTLMEFGDHVPKDVKGAYAWYEKAAARNNADGAVNLGVALVNGATVEKDVPRAFALFRKASQLGSARATFDLAKLISDGVGGKPSEALDLFKQAASLGFPDAHRAAALLLDVGKGVTKDAAGAADEMLRCVLADGRECVTELTGKAQIWSPESVKAIQSKLKTAGYYTGPIDGKSGPALSPALEKWRLLGPPQRA
jgi:TPR repeat protein